jgi:hypothetical protein
LPLSALFNSPTIIYTASTPSLGRAGHVCHAEPGRAEIVATHR